MVFILFGSLLPVMIGIQQSLQVKKERVSAFETLHEAAREISATGKLQGQRQVNNIFYSWKMEEQLCVEYVDYKEQRRRICIE
ncbi:hypothetical protein [Planococcus halocryophilus]|uniref:Competence protein ComG n=1 Tax=Planococcus halocryophilus TaxID=1215089 RepID=A0A1C7DND0_9BACL|nr:hypothetical protein [Planococcus halocryophilus]ANU12937.1 hypothetical protein BBI08_03335 [Planococcus halocryophilus]